jgi:hypothetical protein
MSGWRDFVLRELFRAGRQETARICQEFAEPMFGFA